MLVTLLYEMDFMIISLLFLKISLVTGDSNATISKDNEAIIDVLDNSFDINRLLYGDLTKMDEMFLPPIESLINDKDIDDEDEKEDDNIEKIIPLTFDYLKPKVMTRDIIEFNDITKILNNATRRWRGWYHGLNDPEDTKDKKIAPEELEKREKMRLQNVQWMMHTRYQIKKAILMKHGVRTDPRYKIGYLIGRLKIIKFEQQKIATYAREQDSSVYRTLTSMLYLYEKIVRYDVDIRDTVNLIKHLDNEFVKSLPTDPTKHPRFS